MNEQQANQALYQKMTETRISTLVTGLSIPTIASMLVSALYNTADTFFVSRLGTSASGAAGIVFSIMAIIQSIGFMLGMGAGSQISRLLGAQEKKQASVVASTSFFSALLLGSVIALLGLLFTDPLLKLLGATSTILPYAADYAKYIFFGAPIMCASYVLNNLLRSEGRAAFAMIGITAGGVLNIILDPVFIFVFDLGIAGAAIATLLSQCTGFLLLLSMFLRKRSALPLHIRNLSHKFIDYRNIMVTGFPSFARQGLASIAAAVLNREASLYGDAAVAAMSIAGRIFMLIYSVIIGLGQGFQPVAGHNYGAKRYTRVNEAILFSAKLGTIAATALSLLIFIFAPQVMAAFRADDAEVIRIGSFAMRMQCLSLPFMPFYTISSMTYQVLGKSTGATILSAARQGIFFLPFVLVLQRAIGLPGIQIAQPISDVCCFTLSLFMMMPLLKELKALACNEKEGLPNEI